MGRSAWRFAVLFAAGCQLGAGTCFSPSSISKTNATRRLMGGSLTIAGGKAGCPERSAR